MEARGSLIVLAAAVSSSGVESGDSGPRAGFERLVLEGAGRKFGVVELLMKFAKALEVRSRAMAARERRLERGFSWCCVSDGDET